MARLPRAQRDAGKAQADANNLDQALAKLDISDRATTPATFDSDDEGGAHLTQAEKKAKLHANIIQYFDDTYGRKEDRLEAWQKLCKHVGIEEGASIKACKNSLKKVYINIFDFVTAQQGGPPFKRFGSYPALRSNILRTRKFFPLKKAKDSPILRWMLITVF